MDTLTETFINNASHFLIELGFCDFSGDFTISHRKGTDDGTDGYPGFYYHNLKIEQCTFRIGQDRIKFYMEFQKLTKSERNDFMERMSGLKWNDPSLEGMSLNDFVSTNSPYRYFIARGALRNGIHPNYRGSYEFDLFRDVIEERDSKLVKLLLEFGGVIDFEEIERECIEGSVKYAQSFMIPDTKGAILEE